MLLAARPGAEGIQLPGWDPPAGASLEGSYGDLPLSFMRDGGGFTASTAAGSISLRDAGATIVPVGGNRVGEPIEMGLVGAAASAPQAVSKLPGVVNDLRGDDPSKWRSGIPTFARVRYAEVYPGIAMDYHGTTGTLEYDFRLDPGADPSQIAVDFHGAPVRVTGAGALVVGSGSDRIRQAPPVAFQPRADGRDPVDSSFTLHGDRVGFDLGAYDASRPLTIDPLVLSYATLLGGGDEDRVQDIAVDSTGAAYLTGYTVDGTFPTTSGSYDTTYSGGNTDAFVTKLNPSGSALVYSTLIGGNNTDFADSIALDSSGNAYVTGQTASITGAPTDKFPTAGGAFATSNDSGFGDIFVTKLNATGTSLVYSSVFGGSYGDEARAIAVDSSGAAYVGGYTASTNNAPVGFPTTVGAAQATSGGNGTRDGIVVKLDSSGQRVYSTYLGGTGQDEVNGIDIDSLGRAYVTGFAAAFSNNDFPTTAANRYAAVETNGTDAFLARLTANGSSFDYSTGIGTDGTGGNDGGDYGVAVATGPTDGIAYITGSTRTTGQTGADFPTKFPFQGRPGGCCTGADTFVSKFDTTASGNASLVYSTLLGGTPEDGGSAIDVDSAGNAYVGGMSGPASGIPFPTTSDELGGGTNRGNAFVTKIVQTGTNNATLGFSTTIQGASSDDSVGGLQYDPVANAVYVGGTSRNGQLGTTAGAFQPKDVSGDRDGFAAKITISNDSTPPNTTITGRARRRRAPSPAPRSPSTSPRTRRRRSNAGTTAVPSRRAARRAPGPPAPTPERWPTARTRSTFAPRTPRGTRMAPPTSAPSRSTSWTRPRRTR